MTSNLRLVTCNFNLYLVSCILYLVIYELQVVLQDVVENSIWDTSRNTHDVSRIGALDFSGGVAGLDELHSIRHPSQVKQ